MSLFGHSSLVLMFFPVKFVRAFTFLASSQNLSKVMAILVEERHCGANPVHKAGQTFKNILVWFGDTFK